jgi:hypothetical protein
MTRIDAVLKKYDLKTLESFVERRRAQEERKLKQLEAKRKKLESELERVDREMSLASAAPVRRSGGRTLVRKRRPNARRLNEISLADALEKICRGRKRPVHYKDLTDQVTKRGLYKTRSKNLLSTVAVTLKRDKRFKKVEPGLYTLR